MELLKRLSNVPGVCGFEEAAQDIVEEELKSLLGAREYNKLVSKLEGRLRE